MPEATIGAIDVTRIPYRAWRCVLSASCSYGRADGCPNAAYTGSRFSIAARASVYRCPVSRDRWRTTRLKLPCLVIANLLDVPRPPSDAALEQVWMVATLRADSPSPSSRSWLGQALRGWASVRRR